MNYIQIDNIKLQYDESIEDIKRISEIIKLNQYLFLDYKDKTISLVKPNELDNNDDVVYVTNFDDFFDNLLKKLLQDNNVISLLEHQDLLPASYIQLLQNQESQKEQAEETLNNNSGDDVLWFAIACKFFDYKNSFDEFSHFLKYRQNSEFIFNWLKQTQRFPTYNYLLELYSNYLKEEDTFFFNNMGEIISKMNEEMVELVSSFNYSNYEFPKIPLEDIEKIFFDFLNQIQAPEHWKNLYINLKNNNRILYEYREDNVDNSKVFTDDDGVKKIQVTTNGTIRAFISLVHEFIHYVTLYQQELLINSLIEFPSIYYERVATLYLISIGFDENIITSVIQERNQDNLCIYKFLIDILVDICRYNKKGPITREEKLKPLRKTMKMLLEQEKELAETMENPETIIETLEFFIMSEDDLEKSVNQDCDEIILHYAKNGLAVLNGYQYLIGSYLADSLLERENKDTLLDKMIFITENLSEFNIETASKYLGIENVFSPKSKNRKKTFN